MFNDLLPWNPSHELITGWGNLFDNKARALRRGLLTPGL